ncbi:hypothetical protein BU23DRAFT_593114 [Bimuria novae-zelandiae CBS 107.79]|uniref:Uncharacterized protein n=1 Tax=Bimuria novae-zelandiae CBS 107.79 TaxID=1447943 RepID=A0A6A5UUI6_9PLEO|nr:hypothetical protein BU23DRAFT_593114 [Bimuria novae-zelandiae CBS 107.79]
MTQPLHIRIRRLLISNRGEIATRIISAARELDIETYAIYISGDSSHAIHAAHAIEVSSAATFMDISALVDIARKHEIDAVHPGYGFLSESATFAKRLWDEAGTAVIGPGWEILEATGDKLKARELAEKCNVPVSPALLTPTSSSDVITKFADSVGYPIMVKAVDGGGGRGIRLIRDKSSLDSAVKRAVEESPSKTLFAEKAAVDGFRHIEVQIIGDGRGNVAHLWERECSIQRRYQKIVELAPSTIKNRASIARIIEDAVRMAKSIQYCSLGTFEFLLDPTTEVYYFLEINPRLQVEHTITEAITSTDIVRIQLLLAQGTPLSDCGLSNVVPGALTPPPVHSIQLRITAEDPINNWTLSIGKITGFGFPSGNGMRVDTHLSHAQPTIVSADFDSLIAKLVITASSWEACVKKAQRALKDTRIQGVKTNIGVLRAIVGHPDLLQGGCDTQWLEREQEQLLTLSKDASAKPSHFLEAAKTSSLPALATNALFRKGDAWSLTLTPTTPEKASPLTHHVELSRVLRNEFPQAFSADILFTSPHRDSIPYRIDLASTTASASATTSSHRRANPSDASHISIPFAGKLIEILVDEADSVREGDVICVVQQMKMELEVRSPRSGTVTWIMEAEDGEEVGDGTLAAIVESGKEARL